MFILVINAGSSSVKYQLFEMETEKILAKGLCERIGIDGKLIHKAKGAEFIDDSPLATHTDAIKSIIAALTDKSHGVIDSMSQINAIGHRVVHGGPYFTGSKLVTPEVVAGLENCRELAPLHTGPHLMGINGCTESIPGVPQVLVFDTTFHQTMPETAYSYAFPAEIYDKYKVRKYGFHGTSHKYVSALANKALADAGMNPAETKIVTAHLGNGSSLAAVKGGKCVDTSMGFTPLDGVIMGSRTGTIDPAVVLYLMEKLSLKPDEMSKYLNGKCGLLGVSGISSDLREVMNARAKGEPKSILAFDMLCYGIKKFIGSYAAAMGGLDAIVFTAGIGENNGDVRASVLSGLEFLGVEIDAAKNSAPGNAPVFDVSTGKKAVRIFVIPTNEELEIALETAKVVGS